MNGRVIVLTLASGILTIFVSRPATALDECDKAACKKRGGIYVCKMIGIPGDGVPHDTSTTAPSDQPEFVCGYARARRQGLDNDFSGTCMLNPPQPPTGDNSEQRRCTTPCNDMSVERCTVTGGSNPSLNCQYANANGARAKDLELCGCWK